MFCKLLVKKNVLMITKVSYCFAWTRQMDWGRCILCQEDSSALLLNPCRTDNIEEFQRSAVLFFFWNPCTVK